MHSNGSAQMLRPAAPHIECLVGAQRVQQSAERLLLCSKMWPPPPPPGAASAASPVRSEPGERARRELANLRMLAEQARQRLAAAEGPGGDADEEALVDCGRRLQVTCVQCIESVYRAVHSSLCQQQQQQQQQLSADPSGQQQQLLNRLAVGRACDGLLAAAHGLDLAVTVAAAASAAVSGGRAGARARLPLDDGQLGRLSDQLGQSLADLSRAGRPARLGGDPADAEALQLSVRCAAAAVSQLQHAVRCVRALGALGAPGAAGQASDDTALADLQSRVRLACESLRPAVAAVLAVAGEARFSGRPLRLAEEAKAGKARALGHALPVALATVELLTAMGGGQGQQQQQQQLAEALKAACTDCLAKMQPMGAA